MSEYFSLELINFAARFKNRRGMNEEQLKQSVQKKIVLISSLILVGKFVAYWLTNSVGILTDAMESIVNVVAGAVSLYSLHWSAQPKDKSHPFGHGKMEQVSASIEGILITFAGMLIVYEGVYHLFCPVGIRKLDVGIYIVAFSGLVNYLMGWYSVRIGKRYDSMALIAGGKHLQSDTYSTIGLVAGLLLLYFTKIVWIDSVLAFLFGGIIIVTGISILRKTIANLLDKADEALLNEIAQELNEKRSPDWIDIHNAKVIKYGSYLYMDCDLTLPWFYTIEEGHREGARLKQILEKKYADRIQLTIHLDPCTVFEQAKCGSCSCQKCQTRKMRFEQADPITLATFIERANERKD